MKITMDCRISFANDCDIVYDVLVSESMVINHDGQDISGTCSDSYLVQATCSEIDLSYICLIRKGTIRRHQMAYDLEVAIGSWLLRTEKDILGPEEPQPIDYIITNVSVKEEAC